MSEALTASMAAAAQSLRDTAKWLVAGVVATAASVFVGSSLTAFGSLAPGSLRFGLAVGGLALGFAGIAAIMRAAIMVLTRASLTVHDIATSKDPELSRLHDELSKRYADRLTNGSATLKDHVERIGNIARRQTRSDAENALIARGREDNAVISADASFLFVRHRFDGLVDTLTLATPLAVAGFGLFAWAANPAAPPAPAPLVSLTIRAP